MQRRRGRGERRTGSRRSRRHHHPGVLGRRRVVRVGRRRRRRRLVLGVAAAVPARGGGGGRRGGRHRGRSARLRDGAQLALDPRDPRRRRQDVPGRQRGLRPRRSAIDRLRELLGSICLLLSVFVYFL